MRNVEGSQPLRSSSAATEGVLAIMVTPGSMSAREKASGITRTHPPTHSGPSTSIRWGSKVKEMEVAVIASSSEEKAVRTQARKAARLARLMRTPFGVPVVPDVKMMYAPASQSGVDQTVRETSRGLVSTRSGQRTSMAAPGS